MSKISNTAAIAFAGAALMLPAYPAFGQVDDSKLGKVHFETSCKPEAQKLFDRAMLYQHSFWYRASQKVFDDFSHLSFYISRVGRSMWFATLSGSAATPDGCSTQADEQNRLRDKRIDKRLFSERSKQSLLLVRVTALGEKLL